MNFSLQVFGFLNTIPHYFFGLMKFTTSLPAFARFRVFFSSSKMPASLILSFETPDHFLRAIKN